MCMDTMLPSSAFCELTFEEDFGSMIKYELDLVGYNPKADA